MGVRPPKSTTISSIYSSAPVMDCDCLDKWISSELSVNLVSAFCSPASVWWFDVKRVLVFIHTLSQCCFITRRGPAHSWQQLPNSAGEVLTSSFLFLAAPPPLGEIFWSIFDCEPLCLLSNIKSTMKFKLNYFPQTEHIIPHMNRPLLLGAIIFTIF